MTPISSFSLPKHNGPYESWGLETELFLNGTRTGHRVPGYVIEAQYKFSNGFLLITSWDCPFEEGNEFLLLDEKLSLIDRQSLSPWFNSFVLKTHEPVSENELRFEYLRGSVYCLRVVESQNHRIGLEFERIA